MSYQNRKNEYDRLISLDRQKDICPALMAEFGNPEPIVEPIVEKKKTEIKKKR